MLGLLCLAFGGAASPASTPTLVDHPIESGLSALYNNFDINLTRLSSVASANADSTITTVPCRVLCILLHALFA